MALSQAEIQNIEQLIKAKAPSFSCPACNGPKMSVGTDYYAAIVHPGTAPLNLGAIPMAAFVVVVCDNCSYSSFFSTKTLGGGP